MPWRLISTTTLIVALVVALIVTRARLATEKATSAIAQAELSVTNQSVDRLDAALGECRGQWEAMQADSRRRQETARQMLALQEAAAAVRRAAIDRLNQSARETQDAVQSDPEPNVCRASETLLREWPE